MSDTAIRIDVPERLGYRLKRTLLGKPLVTAQLDEERLTKKTALALANPRYELVTAH